MAGDLPTCIDVMDLRFKAASKVRLFEEWTDFSSPLNLVTSANKYGLIFVATPTNLVAIKMKDLLEHGDSPSCPRRSIPLKAVSHLAVNCDDSLLLVVFTVNETTIAFFLSITSILTDSYVMPKGQVALGIAATHSVVEVAWNPTIPSLLCVCLADGTLTMIDAQPNAAKIVNSLNNCKATCISWSPRGKQIVAGSAGGILTQHTPDLKVVKALPLPQPLASPVECISVCWLSSFQFAVVYKIGGAEDNRLSLCIVNAPKQGAVSCIEYDDICYSSGELRSDQFYLTMQHAWGVLLCASANGMEVGVLGQCQGPEQPPRWQQWCMEDSARAELPMEGTTETFPLGMALNLSSTQPLPWGEETVPPMPVLVLLSQRGLLSVFHVMNLKPQASSICSPPESVTNELPGLFIAKEHSPPLTPQETMKEPPKLATTPQATQEVSQLSVPPSVPQIVAQAAQPVPKMTPQFTCQVPQVAASKPTPQAAQIPKPTPQQPAVQLIQKPAPTQQQTVPLTIPKTQQKPAVFTTQAAKSIEQAKSNEGEVTSSEPLPDLSDESFNNAALNIIHIFSDEMSSALKRSKEQPQEKFVPASVFNQKYEEVQKHVLDFHKNLKDAAEQKDEKLQFLTEKNSKDALNIRSRIEMRNLPELKQLIKSQPLDQCATAMLDNIEQRLLYTSTELIEVKSKLNKQEIERNSKKQDKYEISETMALSKAVMYHSNILEQLTTKYNMLEMQAAVDTNIKFNPNISLMSMKSLEESLESIPISQMISNVLMPLSSEEELLICHQAASEIVPVVASINEPIMSPTKSPFKAAKATPPPSSSAWRQPTAVDSPLVRPLSESPQKSAAVFGFGGSKADSKPFDSSKPFTFSFTGNQPHTNIFNPKSVPALSTLTMQKNTDESITQESLDQYDAVSSETSEASDQEEVPAVNNNPLSLLSSSIEKVTPSFGLSSLMLSKSDVPKQQSIITPVSKPSLFTSSVVTPSFGGSSVFSGISSPAFGASTTFSSTPSVPATNSTVLAPKTTSSSVFTTPKTTAFGSTPLFSSSMPAPMLQKTSDTFSSLASSSSPISFVIPKAPAATTTTSSGIAVTFAAPNAALSKSSLKNLTFGTAATTTSTSATSFGPSSASVSKPSTIFGATTSTLESTKPAIFGTSVATTVKPVTTAASSPFFSSDSTKPSLFGTSVATSADSKTVPSIAKPSTPEVAENVVTTSTPVVTSAGFSMPTTTTSIFGGSTVTTSTPLFGAPSTPLTIFGTDTSSKPSVFGTSASTSTIFGSSSSSTNIFETPAPALGTPSTTAQTAVSTPTAAATVSPHSPASSVFDTPTTTATIFASPAVPVTSTISVFGNQATPVSTTANIFGTSETQVSTVNLFGTATTPSTSVPPVFGTSTTPAVFGSPAATGFGSATTAASVFGTPTVTTTAAPTFGSAAATNIFGGTSFGSSDTSKSVFGTQATPVFGDSSPAPAFGSASSTSAFNTNIFGQAAQSPSADSTTQVASMFGGMMGSSGGSMFDSTSFSKPAASIFGGGSSSTDASQNLFGNVQACSPASSASKNLFGSTASPQNPFAKPSVSAIFGQSPSSGGTSFASPTQNIFGQSATPGPFSSGAVSGVSPFSSPAAASGNTSIFGGSPSFGSTSPSSVFGAPPAFGGGPSFGGAPTFGSGARTNIFGSASSSSVFGGGSQQQPDANAFSALASQNTVTFGNLAQQPPQSGFGGFGAQQQQQQPNNNNQSPSFGGGSFSSWR